MEVAIAGKTALQAEQAILSLNVCDPACGSGRFLVGAAHRLARHLARRYRPDAIVAYYQGGVSKHLKWDFAVENRVMLGHVALAEGTYKVSSSATGSEIEAGKWLSVWGYQDGAWKIARLAVSPNYDALAAAEAAAAAAPAAAPAKK